MRTPLRTILLLVGLAGLGPEAGADPSLDKTGPPPEAAPAALRQVLAPEGARILAEGRTAAELWLRRELPAAPAAPAAMGVSFGAIPEGALVGLARFPEGWTDYRGQAVQAGLYTLRYALQPADGNHTGVSIYRDFLVLVPVADDADPAKDLSSPELFAMSKKASGTNHPATLSLFPLAGPPPEPVLVRNELEQWMLAATAGGLPLGLVVIGHVEAEGY
jgi:hypothetical protein